MAARAAMPHGSAVPSTNGASNQAAVAAAHMFRNQAGYAIAANNAAYAMPNQAQMSALQAIAPAGLVAVF